MVNVKKSKEKKKEIKKHWLYLTLASSSKRSQFYRYYFERCNSRTPSRIFIENLQQMFGTNIL